MARDHIFISYRRDDARGASGRLYDWLRIAFGRERVFRDVDRIGAGRWRDKIDGALAQSAACVAVIGPRWAKEPNLARLADEADPVRHELLTALASDGLTMVPTLVEEVGLPDVKTLPPELRPLFSIWNALSVTETGWEDDTRRLIRDIAAATNLPVGSDLNLLLGNAGTARLRVAELEQERRLQADQIASLHGTFDQLTSRLADASADERSALAAAFAALAKGDTRAAEDAFEREFESQRLAEQESRRRQAGAARNVGNLALLRDVAKAVTFYRKAFDLEPDNAEAARVLGGALITFGDLPAARTALSQAARLAGASGNTWAEMAALGDLGRVEQRLGNLEEADTALAGALALAQQRRAADPEDVQRQLDLVSTYVRVGDLRETRGDERGTLDAYAESLAIAQALVDNNPASGDLQFALMVGYERIGDILLKHGKALAALAAFTQGLASARSLAQRDPDNASWQRALANSYDRIGNVRAKQDKAADALAAYRDALAIREVLAKRDHANTDRQRDLSVSHDRIGDILLKHGDRRGAQEAYDRSLAVAQALAARDSTNTQWQRDLAVSLDKVGDMLQSQGDKRLALSRFRQSFAIARKLVARDPKNVDWQCDLVRSHVNLGMLEYGQRKQARCGHLRKARDILAGLEKSGRLPANLRSGIASLDGLLAADLEAGE